VKRKCFGALLALAGFACAATTGTWETSSTSEFLKGRLQGVSVLPEGWLRPGPALVHNTNLSEPVLWSLAPAPQGGVYAATGHTGRIYHVDSSGAAKLLWKSPQPEVFALCVDAKGQLFAGTSPNGGVYRIENGKGVEVAHLGTKYIWALAATADGSLFAATGEQGRIYKIDAAGHASVYFETGQANVTALALAPNGHLYAGSEPNGLIYDIAAPKRGTVLYDSSLPEIHSIALAADGTIYAAALGGSLTSRISASPTATGAAGSMAVATSPTVISVSEAKESGDGSTPEQSGTVQVQSANKSNVTSTVTPTAVVPPTTVDVSGVEKSAIYRIQPGGRIETLRTSKEENVYDLALVGGTVWFSTDVHGRVYTIAPDRKETLVTETGDGDADRLLNTNEGLWVGLSNPAKAVLVGKSPAASSAYESPVHDASTLARWGQLSWQERGSGIEFQTRSGNSARPDGTWSDWSNPIRDAGKAGIDSPRGRYVQWRAEWPAGSAAQLQDVTVPFLPQNSAPTVRSINVTSVSAVSQNKSQAASNQSQSAYTVTVTDTGDTSSNTSGTTTQTTTRQSSNQTQISWQADDPDGDKLVYTVYFRGEGQSEWKLLRKDVYENTLMLDADTLADGKYFFRVVASDRPANDLRYAQTDELVSTPVLIDNTPPSVTMDAPRRSGSTVDVNFSAQDQAGPLKRCEYSVDAGPWQPLEAADGITDSLREEFRLQLKELGAGEHLVAVRVYDSAGNAGLAKVVIR
jgi:hypothetical protein